MEGQTEWRTDRSNQTEDQLSKTLEKYTAAIPSSGYLAVAAGAMAAACVAVGRPGQMGQFHCPVGAHMAGYRSLQQNR